MSSVFIVFPHQLVRNLAPLQHVDQVILVEEYLFFRQYHFHKQKILLHRSTMKSFASWLREQHIAFEYVESTGSRNDIRELIAKLASDDVKHVTCYDPCDDWLMRRLSSACRRHGIKLTLLQSPLYLNSLEELDEFQSGRKKYFQADFYIHQRKSRKILVDERLEPLNGKWSFDAENRAKYPARSHPPVLKLPTWTTFHEEAKKYVEQSYTTNPGTISKNIFYPVDPSQAVEALDDFLYNRFHGFGLYEDAIVSSQHFLHHSVLTPMLNTGLVSPRFVIDRAIDFAAHNDVPFNSLEGFVRQVIGWREFVRMVYVREGARQRTSNFWNFKRKIPSSFYTGTTGIGPVDKTIHKLLGSGYNHHIERLMIISNFMLLCEFDPDEVYRWFMEMYIDAYDWVMVPNVYGMGQFADGGLMCTKPYISGSNYILKMSDHKKNESWCDVWDALFWRFMHVHRDFFLRNPRLSMLIRTFDKWDEMKRKAIMNKADAFLSTL